VQETHNKSLLRAGGRWSLVCNEVVIMDKLPTISGGEPPGAELSRWVLNPAPSNSHTLK